MMLRGCIASNGEEMQYNTKIIMWRARKKKQNMWALLQGSANDTKMRNNISCKVLTDPCTFIWDFLYVTVDTSSVFIDWSIYGDSYKVLNICWFQSWPAVGDLGFPCAVGARLSGPGWFYGSRFVCRGAAGFCVLASHYQSIPRKGKHKASLPSTTQPQSTPCMAFFCVEKISSCPI